MQRDTLIYGLLFTVAIAAITLLLPVKLYDGFVVMADGTLLPEKLSLSYFVQKEHFLSEYRDSGIVDIRLSTIGMILVGIVNLGLPMLLGYRVSIARNKEKDLS